jgi:Flp pilus assembly protein TadG
MLSPLKTALADRLRRLVRERDGNIAMIFGLCAIPVIVGCGIAIDVGRAYLVRMDLESALDASALAVASSTSLTTAQLQSRLQSYFDANYPMMSQTTNLQVSMTDPTQPVINVTATVDVPTLFLRLINVNQVPVAASNQVSKGTNALELALVLDNTGSMMCGDGEIPNCSSGTAHIDTLRIDAQQIVDTLFQDSVDPTKLKISVVPYVTAVNVGGAFCTGPQTCSNISNDCSGDFVTDNGNTIFNPSKAVTQSTVTTTVTITANVTSGSKTISSITPVSVVSGGKVVAGISPITNAVIPGMSISGSKIPAGTTITAVTATTITMSANATQTVSGDSLTLSIQTTGVEGLETSGNSVITNVVPPVASGLATGLASGEVVTGTGIGVLNAAAGVPDSTSGIWYPQATSVSPPVNGNPNPNFTNNTITLCQPATQGSGKGTADVVQMTLYPPVVYDTTNTLTTGNWKGCVVEPTVSGEDTSGVGPDISEPGGGWTYASMGNQTWWASYWTTGSSSSYSGDASGNPTQFNTWYIPGKGASIQYTEIDGNVNTATLQSYGPNLSCPTPLVRLTNSQTTLDATMQNMTSWANSGTAITVGMIWGWRTLSPNPPFGDGQAYGTPSLIKAVVLETDGDAEVGGNTQGWTQDFTGYGYISEGKLGDTTSGTYPGNPSASSPATRANLNLQNRLVDVCTAMKAAGIVVYTIGLGDGATNTTLSKCAGPQGEGSFYAAPTAADLSTAFQQIANSLNALRLTK